MTARRLAWMVGVGLVLALNGPAAADLRSLCAKGGVALPNPLPGPLGQPGLTGLQCQRGFDDNCTAYKLGFPPEEQIANTTTPLQIEKCICYATCLSSGGGATGLGTKIGFEGYKDPDKKKLALDYLDLMDQIVAYNAANATASPSPGPSPGPSAPAGSCTLTANLAKIKIPTPDVTVTLTAEVPSGTAGVMFHASKAHGEGLDKAGTKVPNSATKFTTTYRYFINSDEADKEITYTMTQPACAAPAVVTLERDTLTALLLGNSPLGIEANADLDLTLRVTGGGDISWLAQLSSDGANWASANVSGTEKHQPGGADRLVTVHFPPFPGLPPGVPQRLVRVEVTDGVGNKFPSNPIRVYLKPKFTRLRKRCDAAKTRLTVEFQCQNRDNFDIEVRGDIRPGGGVVQEATGKCPVGPLVFDLVPPGGGDFKLYLRGRFLLTPSTRIVFYPDPANPGTGFELVSIPKATPPPKQPRLTGQVIIPAGTLEDEECDCDCDVEDVDDDEDGVLNAQDNCPKDANADQADADEDLVGDVCDICPDAPNFEQGDSDEDGVGDVCDTCPDSANAGGEDTDGDGYGDACDNCPSTPNPEQDDTDTDTVGNVCDNCPDVSNLDQADDDGNGTGNVCPEEPDCVPETCCPEFPEPCGDDCYEPCLEGEEADPADCSLCNEVADLEPPIVEIQVPASGSTVPAGATVQVSALFTDAGPRDQGVTTGIFTASGPALASGAAPGGFGIGATAKISQHFAFTVKSDLTGITDRNIVITAQGGDAAGNQSAVVATTVVAGGAGLSLLLSVNPPDPGPGQAVTVTITVTNCDPSTTQVTYSVAGTDGYSAGSTLGVNSSCQASFGIPGGAAGVVDVVTAEVTGAGVSRTVSYVF